MSSEQKTLPSGTVALEGTRRHVVKIYLRGREDAGGGHIQTHNQLIVEFTTMVPTDLLTLLVQRWL